MPRKTSAKKSTEGTAKKKEVSQAKVKEAIKLRKQGVAWSEVTEKTGLTPAVARPLMKEIDPDSVSLRGRGSPNYGTGKPAPKKSSKKTSAKKTTAKKTAAKRARRPRRKSA